jgi:hypothetical protein
MTPDDLAREARARRRLAETLGALAEHPDDAELVAQARRLSDAVAAYDTLRAMHHHSMRWRLYQDTRERRN